MGTQPSLILIRKEIIKQMVTHCKQELPNEACGVLAARNDTVIKVFPMKNIEGSPTNYMMDSKEQLQVFKEIESSSLELAGFYHSHVASGAYPSDTDKTLAFYPEAYYFIISLTDLNKPVIKAYQIVNGKVEERAFIINEFLNKKGNK